MCPGAGRSAAMPGPPGSRNVRLYVPSRHSSTPGTAWATRCPNRSAQSGSRNGSRTAMDPVAAGEPASIRPANPPRAILAPALRVARSRSSVGVSANTCWTVSLNCRTLPNPAAKATSASLRSVVSASRRAVCARWARASASGPAPSSAIRDRSSCRRLYPRRVARPGTPLRSTSPSAISRTARATRSARRSHWGDPGVASGRHRLQARKPAAWAPAAAA